MKFLSLPKWNSAFAIFALALTLRVWNIGSDLPNLYIPDEPHHINTAAHMGTGDLNPHDFKYPSLWKYTLAFLLAGLYATGRLLGVTSSPLDFAGAFFINPTVFYLSARLLAACFFALGAAVLCRTGERFYNRGVGWAMGLLLALSPAVISFGRDATLYSLMILLICAALHMTHTVIFTGGKSDTIKLGLIIGLTVSTHYLAAPLAVLIPTAYLASSAPLKKWANAAYGLIAVGIGVVIGSPYLLLDFNKASQDLGQLFSVVNKSLEAGQATVSIPFPEQFHLVLQTWRAFLDPIGICWLLLALAFVFASKLKLKPSPLVWMAPWLLQTPLALLAFRGWFYRYSIAVFLPMIVPVAVGAYELFAWIKNKNKWAANVYLLALIVPAAANAMLFARSYGFPDTRTIAREWILANVPAGEKVFLADPFNCPQLLFSKPQVEKLLARAKAINHPREKYFQAILGKHPGNGYELVFLRRSSGEVEDLPKRTEAAYQALDTLDPAQAGFAGLEKEGIRTVVLYADVEKKDRHQAWIEELEKKAVHAAHFEPVKDKTKGPGLDIYRLTVSAP